MDQQFFEQAYSSLKPFTRTALNALAMVYEPCTISDLQYVLRSSDVPRDCGRVANHPGTSDAIFELLDAKLITGPKAGRYVCRNSEWVLLQAVKDPFFEVILETVRRSRPWQNAPQCFGREIALAIHTGSRSEIENIAGHYEKMTVLSPQRVLADLVGKPFSREVFDRLPLRLRVTALFEMVTLSTPSMEPIGADVLAAAEATLGELTAPVSEGILRMVLAELMLMFGRPAEALRYLGDRRSDVSDEDLRGWAAVLLGDDVTAGAAFSRALEAARPVDVRQPVAPLRRATLFYGLHLLRIGTAKAQKQLEGFLRAALRNERCPSVFRSLRLLEAALCLQRGDAKAAAEIFSQAPGGRHGLLGHTRLLEHLVSFWLSGDQTAAEQHRLTGLFDTASRNSIPIS